MLSGRYSDNSRSISGPRWCRMKYKTELLRLSHTILNRPASFYSCRSILTAPATIKVSLTTKMASSGTRIGSLMAKQIATARLRQLVEKRIEHLPEFRKLVEFPRNHPSSISVTPETARMMNAAR